MKLVAFVTLGILFYALKYYSEKGSAHQTVRELSGTEEVKNPCWGDFPCGVNI